ncbi:MAG TPA: hypothetical protein VGK84_08315 [Candidatus Tumulicola sp.]
MTFAQGWKLTHRDIDFNGTTFWDMDGYCSVDLDGNAAGGIVTSPFATQRGAKYDVSFSCSATAVQAAPRPLSRPFP